MSETRDDVESELAALRRAFADKLPERVDGLAAAIERARSRGTPGDALEEAIRCAHSLRGSVATYGIMAPEAALAALEAALERMSAEGPCNELWLAIEAHVAELRANLPG